MNMKNVRLVHLYLGCFFAPLLVFFTVTGCAQMFAWHEQKKSDPRPPSARTQLFDTLGRVHMHGGNQRGSAPASFRLLILAMTAGFLVTVFLGVWMAFRFSQKPMLVWLCLLSGILIASPFLAKAFRVD